MMRKPAVIVGLILIPLVTTSAVVVHLTNSSTGSGDAEHPALMSTPQEVEETSHASSSGTNSESAATNQSDVEGSTGTNNSKEHTPPSESSGGESDSTSSEPTSEVMLAEAIKDQPSSYSLALPEQQTSSLDFPRTGPYGTRSGSVGLGAVSASAGNTRGRASSNSGSASLADVKNTPRDSLPAQEQPADPVVEDTSDAVLGETSLAHTNPTQTGESNDSSIPHFPSEPQPEEILEDAPELVSETGPTPPYSYDETWPKQYSPAPVQVPEPSSLMLLGLGLIGLAVASRKRA
jgi:hypothetical protein